MGPGSAPHAGDAGAAVARAHAEGLGSGAAAGGDGAPDWRRVLGTLLTGPHAGYTFAALLGAAAAAKALLGAHYEYRLNVVANRCAPAAQAAAAWSAARAPAWCGCAPQQLPHRGAIKRRFTRRAARRRLRAGLAACLYNQVLLSRAADAAGGPEAATLMGVDAPRAVNLVPSFQVRAGGWGSRVGRYGAVVTGCARPVCARAGRRRPARRAAGGGGVSAQADGAPLLAARTRRSCGACRCSWRRPCGCYTPRWGRLRRCKAQTRGTRAGTCA